MEEKAPVGGSQGSTLCRQWRSNLDNLYVSRALNPAVQALKATVNISSSSCVYKWNLITLPGGIMLSAA
ncbi:hypothetical protein ACLKA6_001912 [Drosophila palustris]